MDDAYGPQDPGGDPACWLDRVCVVCGGFRAEADEPCPRCGAGPQEASGGA